MTLQFALASVGAVLAVGALAVLVLRALSRASIFVHLFVLSIATVLCVVSAIMVSMVVFGTVDAADLISSALIGAVGSLIVSLVLGVWVVRNSASLGRLVRSFADGSAKESEPALPEGNAETTAVVDELLQLRGRLAAAERTAIQMEHSRRELLTLLARDLRVPLEEVRAARTDRSPERLDAAVLHLDAMVVDLIELTQATARSAPEPTDS